MELVMKFSSPTADHHTRATRRLLCPHTHMYCYDTGAGLGKVDGYMRRV